MFFILSKTAGFFALPSNLLFSIGLLGAVLLLTRFARLGRRLLVVGFIGIGAFGVLPLGKVLLLPLEQRFPSWDEKRGAPDGIIILGGAISTDISAARGEPSLNDSAERLTIVPELARRFPNARILFSGGTASLIRDEPGEATFAKSLLASLGVPADRILVEDRSRNTAENAAFTRAVLDPKPGQRFLLVTSAVHMPRAIGCFRREGFDVEAYPVDWRTHGNADALISFTDVAPGLLNTDYAVKEWVGLLVYWLTGRTSALFPGP